MNNLTIINQEGKLLVESREVARMVDRPHDQLMRSIRGFAEILEKDISAKMQTSNFFIESTFKDSYGREQPCYLLTRKGCDMVANKMTGEKGIIFTAIYVTKFEEMERQQQTQIKELSPQLQLLINMELKQNQLEIAVTQTKEEITRTKQDIQDMKDVISINPKAEWRKETNKILLALGNNLKNYSKPRKDVYDALQERGKCRPNVLINNLKQRALENGMTPSSVDKLNLLDVLENNPRLREIYITIVKEMAIKHL